MKEDEGENSVMVVDVPVTENSNKLSLDEITEDVGAFLHFLKNNFDHSSSEFGSIENTDVCSVWMLIPYRVEVKFRKGVEDCYMEKEVFSRTLWIVSEPVEKEKEKDRRRELLKYFSNILYEDQMDQITILLKKLNEDSRQKILKEYREFRERQTGSATQIDS